MSTRRVRTPHGPRIVTGRIVRYFPTRGGFGFAEFSSNAGDDSVEEAFFHRDNCRLVTGTLEEPVLTDQRVEYVPSHHGRQECIVMQVIRGEKGLRAPAWGFIPRQQNPVVAALLRDHTLDSYVGRSVEIKSALGKEGYLHGTLKEVNLTPSRLVIVVTYSLIMGDQSMPGAAHQQRREFRFDEPKCSGGGSASSFTLRPVGAGSLELVFYAA